MKHSLHSNYTYINISISFSQHIQDLISFLTADITEMTSFKHAFKYPFIATEILSIPHSLITSTIPYYQLISTLNKPSIQHTTIPGYIVKIIMAHFNSNPDIIIKSLAEHIDNIIPILYNNINNDSYAELIVLIITKCISFENGDKCESTKERYYRYIENLISNYIHLESSRDDNDESNYEILLKNKNAVYVLISLIKALGDELVLALFNTNALNHIVDEFKSKSDYHHVNVTSLLHQTINKPSTPLTQFDSTKYRYWLEFLSNFLRLAIIELNEDNKDTISNTNLALTSIYETNAFSNTTTAPLQVKLLSKTVKNKINDFFYENNLQFLIWEISIKTYSSSPFNSRTHITKSYLTMLDIYIMLIHFSKIGNEDFITEELLEHFAIILKRIPSNSFFYMKIIRIIELVLMEGNHCTINRRGLFRDFMFMIKDFVEDKVIKENGYCFDDVVHCGKCLKGESLYLVKIYGMLVWFYNKENKYLDYVNATMKESLYKDEVQEMNDVDIKNEDEEVFEQNKDLHDTEAYIFTTKKLVETSKKVNQKLKELDSF